MLSLITQLSSELYTNSGFFALLGLFAIGGLGALCLMNYDRAAHEWSSVFAIIGSAFGTMFGIIGIVSLPLQITVPTNIVQLFRVTFTIDPLASFFIATISFISLWCSIYGIEYVRHYIGRYSLGLLSFSYTFFILGMLLVVSASNAILFLIAWELMSLASYALVVFDYHDPENSKAGFLYFVMTHIGTACITLLFLILYKFTGSFDFEAIRAGSSLIPPIFRDLVFILGIVGFGTKAGIIPFHIWLPAAHPAAPSHVSALMSGVMIKTGIYMLIRLCFGFFTGVPISWGMSIVVLGAVSSLLGVLYALTEHDIKRLLAYHSIENIGIILLGMGSALVFISLGQPAIAMIGLTAALFHTVNHATFKSLLFLGAGAVIHETHTRNIEEYGGLIKRMPLTALYFIIGSMAISALPPFNGFFSEWLTMSALFPGVALLGSWGRWVFILGAAGLATTGGLALACFVKACGATFLARPRSEAVEHAHEVGVASRIAMASLALSTLLLGVFSSAVIRLLLTISNGLLGGKGETALRISSSGHLVIGSAFSSLSPHTIFFFCVGTAILLWIIVRYTIYPKQHVVTGITWDCGTDLLPRMEITATGFSHSIIRMFGGISVADIYRRYAYKPIAASVEYLSLRTKKVQTGNINSYVLYILLTLIFSLYFFI